ncbi:hypothetical protein ACVMIH_003780 [Bradyrhizobium sp. USDA 4503]
MAGGTGEQRARQHAVVAPHAYIGGEIGVAHQRADPQAAVRGLLDAVERQVVDVDQMRRRLDLELHQVEQIRTAGDELGVRGAGGGCGRRARRGGALIAE